MERLLADAQKKQLAEEFPTNGVQSNMTAVADNWNPYIDIFDALGGFQLTFKR